MCIKVVVKTRGRRLGPHCAVSSVGLTQDCAHQDCQVVSCGASKKGSLECRKLCRFYVVDVQGDLPFVRHQHCAPSCQIRVIGCDQCALVESRHGLGWWVEWLRETKRTGHSMRCKLGIPVLWHKGLAAVRGHLARMTTFHPGAAAVQWRSADWWEIMKHTGVGNVDQT